MIENKRDIAHELIKASARLSVVSDSLNEIEMSNKLGIGEMADRLCGSLAILEDIRAILDRLSSNVDK